MMLYFTERAADCVGCTACVAACPMHCITMETDAEGFLYPVASDACVHCGKCERVCPLKQEEKPTAEPFRQFAVAALSRNQAIWLRSASGGAFSELCRAFGDENTLVCGAAWDGLRVQHRCVMGVENIAPLCRSKYVASDLKAVFGEIKAQLSVGGKAVFCGTPCQVAGLRRFLGDIPETLLLIDFICHGVGSPLVFEESVRAMEKQWNIQIEAFDFRAKHSHTDTENDWYVAGEPYTQLFLKQYCLRPSCGGECHFRDERRQGDVTIADFKGLEHVFPQLKGTKKNYSAMVFNTERGAALLPQLRRSMTVLPCEVDDVKQYNPLFYRHTWSCEEREAFFTAFGQSPAETVAQYTKPARRENQGLKNRVWRALPCGIRRFVMRRQGMKGSGSPYESTASAVRIRVRK